MNKLKVGCWYKNKDWCTKKDFLKVSRNGALTTAHGSECIRNGYYETNEVRWDVFNAIEASIDEYSDYLPDGHPDKKPLHPFEVGKWYVSSRWAFVKAAKFSRLVDGYFGYDECIKCSYINIDDVTSTDERNWSSFKEVKLSDLLNLIPNCRTWVSADGVGRNISDLKLTHINNIIDILETSNKLDNWQGKSKAEWLLIFNCELDRRGINSLNDIDISKNVLLNKSELLTNEAELSEKSTLKIKLLVSEKSSSNKVIQPLKIKLAKKRQINLSL
jgi:hypothetical protein